MPLIPNLLGFLFNVFNLGGGMVLKAAKFLKILASFEFFLLWQITLGSLRTEENK